MFVCTRKRRGREGGARDGKTSSLESRLAPVRVRCDAELRGKKVGKTVVEMVTVWGRDEGNKSKRGGRGDEIEGARGRESGR